MKKLISSLLIMSAILFPFSSSTLNSVSAQDSDKKVHRIILNRSDDRVYYTVNVTSDDPKAGTVRILNAKKGSPDRVTVQKNSIVTVVATPAAGYVLNGWFNGFYCCSSEVRYSFRPERNTTLKGVFVPQNFSYLEGLAAGANNPSRNYSPYPYRFILLDGCGGTFSNGKNRLLGVVKIYKGTKIGSLPPSPFKLYHTFWKFNTKPDGSGEDLIKGSRINGCRHYYAIYKRNKLTQARDEKLDKPNLEEPNNIDSNTQYSLADE